MLRYRKLSEISTEDVYVVEGDTTKSVKTLADVDTDRGLFEYLLDVARTCEVISRKEYKWSVKVRQVPAFGVGFTHQYGVPGVDEFGNPGYYPVNPPPGKHIFKATASAGLNGATPGYGSGPAPYWESGSNYSLPGSGENDVYYGGAFYKVTANVTNSVIPPSGDGAHFGAATMPLGQWGFTAIDDISGGSTVYGGTFVAAGSILNVWANFLYANFNVLEDTPLDDLIAVIPNFKSLVAAGNDNKAAQVISGQKYWGGGFGHPALDPGGHLFIVNVDGFLPKMSFPNNSPGDDDAKDMRIINTVPHPINVPYCSVAPHWNQWDSDFDTADYGDIAIPAIADPFDDAHQSSSKVFTESGGGLSLGTETLTANDDYGNPISIFFNAVRFTKTLTAYLYYHGS